MHVEPGPGAPQPLGATPQAGGTNFALFSRHAEALSLVLFGADGREPEATIPMSRTGDTHHAFVPAAGAGAMYGYRAHGPWDPGRGHRFNPAKLLLDPYARAVSARPHDRDGLLCGHDWRRDDLVRDERDSSPVAPRSVVVDPAFDWRGDSPPRVPYEDLVIYETHVKGFTAHPSSGVTQPGTYLGFIEKIPHLTGLGINAVELLPVQQAYSRAQLEAHGLGDYWGYNTIAFFAPEASYRSGPPGSEVAELKTLVRELHRAGIEVILDVAYNHTGEGDHLGPTICWRGLDNLSYYRLEGRGSEPLRFYRDETGALNTLALERPQVQSLVLDALRYWVTEMHVDGFRLDLAPLHALHGGRIDPEGPFLAAIAGDPLLRGVKLVAEPWGPGLYHLGSFPRGWSEWNDRFRDTVRSFLRGERGQVRDIGWRLTGSADLFESGGRGPGHSINYVTCHDGFTLADLWSYNHKHNHANREGNRDGSEHNRSWNCGAEGESRDPAILALRRRMARNAVCCLLFSLGAPMILGGDEVLRTQGGNNNAYCQDNETSWLDWSLAETHADFLRFVREAIAFRRRHPALRRRLFLTGASASGDSVPDIAWLDAHLRPPDWHNAHVRSIAFQLDARSHARPNGGAPGQGEGQILYFALNAGEESHIMHLPAHDGLLWHRAVDTSLAPGEEIAAAGDEAPLEPADRYILEGRSIVVLVALQQDQRPREPHPQAGEPAGLNPPPT